MRLYFVRATCAVTLSLIGRSHGTFSDTFQDRTDRDP